MARQRTPSGIVNLHRDRAKRPGDPVPAGDLPTEPPEHLSPEARQAWREIVENALPGAFGNSDQIAVEVAACLVAEFRASPGDMQSAKIAQLNSLLSRFGMTPADRTKVVAVEPEPDDPWMKL